MQLLRIGVAILWLTINIIILGGIFGVRSQTDYCLELYPPQCKTISQFGWPEPWLKIEQNTRSSFQSDAIRQLVSLYVLFLAPSLFVAVITGKVLRRADTRN